VIALIILLITHVHIIAGAHPQVIVGSDLTGYLNFSRFGILYAQGSW
jgi:hypothetical protein